MWTAFGPCIYGYISKCYTVIILAIYIRKKPNDHHLKKYHTVTLPLPITSANIPLFHMTNPTITVFTLPKMNDPNRMWPTVPKSLKTAIAAWQHVQFSSRLTSFLFCVWCPVSWSSGFEPEHEKWKGRGEGGGRAEACNGLKHHASFLSEGLCWLPSRWFTGPWRSRFVLLPETGLQSWPPRCRKKKKIHFNKMFNLVSFIFVSKK